MMSGGTRATTSQAEWPAKAAAAVVAVLVNVAVIVFLATWRDGTRSLAPVMSATQLVWVFRVNPVPAVRPDEPLPVMPVRTPRSPQSQPQPRQRPEPDSATLVQPDATVERTHEPRSVPVFPSRAQRDSTQHESFRRDAFTDSPPDPTVRGDRMALRFHDRSIGGRLQEMTRRGICGDLRKALLSGNGSAETILASMRERGCEP